MIRIAICDDNAPIAEITNRYLRAKAQQLWDKKLDISLYKSGVDFLRDVEGGTVFHIVFMDIEMPGMDGVEVGQALRKKLGGDKVLMIYVSSHDSFFKGLAEIDIFDFVRKPIDGGNLDNIFNRALEELAKREAAEKGLDLFVFEVGTESHSIKISEIAYLKAKKSLFSWGDSKEIIEIYTWDGINETIGFLEKFAANINDVIKQLPKGLFVRCGSPYIVNLDYVSQMTKDSFALMGQGSMQIPIDEAYKDQAKIAYFKYKR